MARRDAVHWLPGGICRPDLPSPYYLTDDVQYYAPGSEFKLANEAAAMKEQAEAIQSKPQEAPGQAAKWPDQS